ncbi:MAG: EAL domain-containing protein [Burkholderiales bacterium]|nr:EAL domain-containing protein [Burkholderiales bacterium]
MKVQTKEAMVTAVSLLAVALIVSTLLWTYRAVDTANRQRQQASEIARGLSQLRLLTFEYRLYRSSDIEKKWYVVSGTVDRNIENTETSTPMQKELLERLRERRSLIKKIFGEIVDRYAVFNAGAAGKVQEHVHNNKLFSGMLAEQQKNFQDIFRLTDIASNRILEAQRRLLFVALGGLGLIALIKILSWWRLRREVLQPIGELEFAAGHVGQHSWSFKARAGDDEVAGLGASLNAMAARIEAQANALMQARDGMEQMVRERTAELENALKELQSSQAALIDSEQRFRAIFDHAGVGITMRSAHDRNLPWIQVNDHFCKMLGYSREELLKLSTADITPPEHLANALADNESMKKGDLSFYAREKQVIRKDGQKIWVLLTVSTLAGPDGKPVNLIATYQDINQRHEAEISIRRLNRVYAVLSGINLLISRVHDLPLLLPEACRIAVEQGGFALAWIGIHDNKARKILPVAWAGEHSEALAKAGTSATPEHPLGHGVTGRAVELKRPVFINDLTLWPDFGSPRRREAIRLGYRSTIALPLIVDGEAVAVLTLYAIESGFFDAKEVALLTELAGNVSIGMEGIERQRKIEKLSRIRAVSARINAAIVRIRDRETLLRETCNIVFKHGGFELIWIGDVNAEKREIRSVAWNGFPIEVINQLDWSDLGEGKKTLAEAMRTGKAYVRHKLDEDLPAGTLRSEAITQGYASSACLPLQVEGQVEAFILLFSKEEAFFDEDELELLKEVAADVSLALQTIKSRERLDYLSYYDPLTGLPNRTLFMDRASQQMRMRGEEQRIVALMLVNIDRFRYINETFGRSGGDTLLKLVARRLETSFHGKDYIARIDADSFAVVVRGIADSSRILHIIEDRILSCFAGDFDIEGKEVRVAAKVGVAVFPTDGEDADKLYHNAEAALKMARDLGERHLFYAAEMNARAEQTLTLETRLRKAVQNQEFVLYYHPKHCLASGRIVGMEALIRWQDPASGLVPPGVFISLLEETGLILEVGKWALNEVLRQHSEWTALGLKVPRIAVNVSAIQLQQKNFSDVVIGAVQAQGDNPDALELEITESLLMKDVQASLRTLSVLRGLGVTIAMDDFGTGYSSLAYIARLPITSIKIDRAFITGMTDGPQNMSIVTTVVGLAHAMNLKVVAEGVETREQADLLSMLKCDEVQGYLFSKPVPAQAMQALLEGSAAGQN